MKMNRKPILVNILVVILLIMQLFNQIPVSRAQTPPPPVLLVTNAAGGSPYGAYLGEILRAEGLNAFDTADLSQLTASLMAQYSLVLLSSTALTSAQAADLHAYVYGGGRLLAMRPDGQIADLFGLSAPNGTLTDGYLKIATSAGFDGKTPGAGLAAESLQTHGTADLYAGLASGAVMLGELYSNASTATGRPAVAANVYGAGRAAAFTFDLPQSIALMRQGNPAKAGVDTDGDGVLRTIDLFQKAYGTAPWVDLNKVPIPQADEQQRLLARLVNQLVNQPAPQLWYFPGTARTMMVFTGDAHGNPTSYYQTEISSLNKYGAKMTFYMSIASQPDNTTVQNWRSQGHEFGVHPYTYKPDSYPPYNVTNLSQGYDAMDYWWNLTFTSPKSATVRNHQVAWLGYTDAADLQIAHGMAMDTDFYSWGPWLQKADGSWAHGYITGSGLPMKFVKLDGTILNTYQQLTTLIDEQLILGAGSQYENLTAAQGFAVSKALIDASQAGYYSALMTQNHVDYYVNGDPLTWNEQMMAYAQSLGIPMWNADQWLRFTQTRHDANYSNLAWNSQAGTLTFDLTAAATSGVQLTTLLPMSYNGLTLASVQVNGASKTFQQISVKGTPMAFISVAAGSASFTAQYQPSGATLTPTVTLSATPTSTSSPTPTATPFGAPTATPTATGAPTATPTFTLTPTLTPLAATSTSTPTPTLTPTAALSSGSLVNTSIADFNQACVLLNQVHVSDVGGGAVALAAAFADDFNLSTLNASLWLAGSWSGGGYTPNISASVINVHAAGGAWVRSVPAFTHGSLEALAQFGSGPYEHIGFGSDGFSGNRYLIFSTLSGDGNLYARVNNNGSEQNVKIGAIPGGFHRYHIDWTALNSSTDQVVFYLDGAQVASFSLSSSGATGYYVYLSNTQDAPSLDVDAVQAAPNYLTPGQYTSCALDAGSGNAWNQVAWNAVLPAGTAAQVETQLSDDNLTWSAWSTAASSAGTALSPARYARYRLSLSTSDLTVTPLIHAVTLSYTQASGATSTPTATATSTSTPTPTSTSTATATLAPSATSTPTPTSTPVPTATSTPTATDTPTPTATSAAVPSATPTPTPSATDTPTPLATSTSTPTLTPTLAATSTPTAAPTSTSTASPTATATPTSTSTPTPTATATATASPAFPNTVILDNFNRANGGIGANWGGATGSYAISSNQLKVVKSGAIFWKTQYGASQQVFVTLNSIVSGSEIDLVLKSQSNQYNNRGMLEVTYDPSNKLVKVQAYTPGSGWTQYGANIALSLANGDQFGATAGPDGSVKVYKNGTLIATRSVAGWTYAASGGYIGLWMVSVNNSLLDNFGGGTY